MKEMIDWLDKKEHMKGMSDEIDKKERWTKWVIK